tara:strand:- start:696 stop:881 length:186 start_codon:yes stop_codon:yes gene_type:complete
MRDIYINLLLTIICFTLGGLMVTYGESTMAVSIGYIQFGLAGFNFRNYIESRRKWLKDKRK